MTTKHYVALLAFALVVAVGNSWLAGAVARAQLPSASAELPTLPTAAEQWANSSPLTYEGMKGKAVVFWYFEEQCPSCAKKWVGLKELAKAHADDPVLFVGVNSGTEPRRLAAYMQQNDVDWPVIADFDRSFEQASGINEISLQNIHQVKVLTADGTFVNGRWNDLPGTVETALQGASWKANYDGVPPEFHAVVRRMEFGDYRPAAKAIAAGLKDRSPEIKKTAAQLQQAIQKKMTDAVAAATAGSNGDSWVRYTALEMVADQFAPHPLPKSAAAELKELQRVPAVQNELKAAKALAANEPLLASGEERERQRAIKILSKVVESYPETRGAAKAKELLAAAGAEGHAG
jgi:thiol-disulfide isomerase/thioredoxin